MFRKFEKPYNPKINYKMVYFLNPKLDLQYNYYETINIFYHNKDYESEQGKWFQKLNNIFRYLLNDSKLTIEMFEFAAKQLNTKINIDVISIIQKEKAKFNNESISKYATILLYNIILNKPLNENNDLLAVLLFNVILIKNNFIPIIFTKDNIYFLNKMINKKISYLYIYQFLEQYKDLSFSYDNEYLPLSKSDVINVIQKHRKILKNNFGIKTLWIYGSFRRNEQTIYSDIDLYVRFYKEPTNEINKQVKKYLTIVLGRTVDLLIDNYSYINYSDNALKEREVIFDDSK